MKNKTSFLLLVFIAFATILMCPFIGVVPIGWSEISSPSSSESTIFWSLRIPRTLLAFGVGAALSISGMVFQAMFRNVLATPFTLGVSGGAAFGAAMYFKFFALLLPLGVIGPTVCALAGALLSMTLVIGFASPYRGSSSASMLLAGVMVSFFFSSLTLLIQYVSDSAQIFQLSRWLMGTLDTVGYHASVGVGMCTLIGACIIWYHARTLDLLSLGEELATSRGVSIQSSRIILFLVCSVMIASVVTSCGPIGFVGLMVPLALRSMVGTAHGPLCIACILGGGSLLTWCDTAARTLLPPAEIPVGVLTALLGVPCFVLVLRRSAVQL